MAAKVPIRAVFSGTTATGLAEYQSSEFIALTYGGLGASLSIGSAGQVLKVNDAGNAVEFGTVSSADPSSADGDSLGTASAEWSDLYLADGGVIYLGNDQDVTLTHVADTGILLNSTMQLQFNDSSQYINAPSNAILDINATDEIELNATLADVNANLDVSGTYTGGGLMTTGGNIVIPDAGNIGSASDTDAIAISSGGVVTMNQIPVFSAGINVSGGSIAGTLSTAAQGNVTSLGTLTALTVDNVVINGATIGHGDDTDLMTVADGVLTVAGELDAATLDISGNADIDGTLEADAYTVDGTTLAEYIADTAGAMVSSNTETGITVTYQDGDNTIDFAVDAAQTGITSIYNTSLAIGYGSSHANIDFGTDNRITFDIDGTSQVILLDGVFRPTTDSDVDLGASAKYWKDAYIDTITTTGLVTAGGRLITDDATEATSTTDGSLQTDGGLSVVKDAVFGDDVKLLSDAAVISFGANSEVTVTHVHDTGLLLNSTMQLQFNDASQYINAPSATVLDINATDEIELNATLADVNANLDVSGTYTGGGLMTTGGNIVIPNAGNIGSASDTDAIAISSGGVVTFSQNPVFPDGGIAVADLDIDGATDIGAAIVDADLFIVDDGAGGTNRKVTASRLKTYAGGGTWNVISSTDFDGSASSATFTGIDSTYDIYCIMISAITPGADDDDISLRLGTSGGIISSEYYDSHNQNLLSSSNSYAGAAYVNQTRIRWNSAGVGNDTDEGVAGWFYLLNPSDTATRPYYTGAFVETAFNGDNHMGQLYGCGNDEQTIDRIQIYSVGGNNIASGRATLYGIAHS